MSDQVEMLEEQAGKVAGADEPAAEAVASTPAEASNPAAPDAAAPVQEPSAESAEGVAAEETPVEADSAAEMVAEGAPAEPAAVEGAPSEEKADYVMATKAMVAEGAPVEPVADESAPSEEKAAYVMASKAMVAEGAPVEEPAPEAAGDEAVSEDSGKEASAEARDAENKRVVRTLSVGQQVTGTVKRVADFGAFVDIGVGRDGLIHISELSVRRVGKVTDVLNEGQEVTAWIKKLDRDRNRISLTLIDPGTKTIRDLEKGELVQGTVTRILPYGAFIDIGVGRDALLHVREMGEGYVAKPEDVVKVGESIEARIIELSRRRGRVDLSLKGLRPEPEPVQTAPAQAQEQQAADEPDVDEAEDTFEDIDVLSPMELAFKKAMQAEGIELNVGKKSGKRNRRDRARSIQDEIIARTLSSGKK